MIHSRQRVVRTASREDKFKECLASHMLAVGFYPSFLNAILPIKNMSAMARSRKKPGINGGFIFKGKTFAGTFGCRCVRIAVTIIIIAIADAKIIVRLNTFFDNFFPNRTLPRKSIPTEISPIMPGQYKDSLIQLVII